MSKNLKAEFTAPWGNLSGDQPIREHVKYFMNQLEYMLRNGLSPNPNYSKIDLKSYKILYDDASDATIKKFMQIKSNAKDAGKRFPNNVAVVNHMKSHGLWDSR